MIKNRSWKKILAFVLICIMCTSSAVLAQSKVDSLTIAIHTDEGTLTPFTFVRGYPGIEVARLIFDSLFTLNENNEVIPWMVEEDYSIDDEFQVYQLTLREGLKWHDGERVTAEDVKFSFEYALTQNSSRWRGIASGVEEVIISDERNFTIVLKNGDLDFLQNGLADFMIVPKHIYEDIEDGSTLQETVGSGMYKLVEYTPDQFYKLEAMKDYFMGSPKVKNIMMPIINDSGANFQALRAGEIAATTAQLAPELVKSFQGAGNMEIMTGAGFGSTLLQLNIEKYPLNETKFRQALAYAIDVEELVERILLGYGDKGNLGFYHPNTPYGKNRKLNSMNIEKSNNLLEELGFTEKNSEGIRLDGDGKPLEFELLVNGGSAIRSRTAEIIASHLKEIGIKINIVPLEANTLDDRVWPGFDVSQGRNYDMAMWGWSGPMQMSSNVLIRLFASSFEDGNLNIGAYQNEKFDILATEFHASIDIDERNRLIEEMMRIIEEEIPFITLYYPQTIMAYDASKYDGWVMHDGMGIINKFSFLGSEETGATLGSVEEPTGVVMETSDDKKSTNPLPWLLVVLAAGLVVFTLIRRKNKEDEDDSIY